MSASPGDHCRPFDLLWEGHLDAVGRAVASLEKNHSETKDENRRYLPALVLSLDSRDSGQYLSPSGGHCSAREEAVVACQGSADVEAYVLSRKVEEQEDQDEEEHGAARGATSLDLEQAPAPADFERATPVQRVSMVLGELGRLSHGHSPESLFCNYEVARQLELLLPVLLSRHAHISVRNVVASLLRTSEWAPMLISAIVSNDPLALDSAMSGVIDAMQEDGPRVEIRASEAAVAVSQLSPMVARLVRLRLMRYKLLGDACIEISVKVLQDCSGFVAIAGDRILHRRAGGRQPASIASIVALTEQIFVELDSAKQADARRCLKALCWILLSPSASAIPWKCVRKAPALLAGVLVQGEDTASLLVSAVLILLCQSAALHFNGELAEDLHSPFYGELSHCLRIVVESPFPAPGLLAALILHRQDAQSILLLCQRLCNYSSCQAGKCDSPHGLACVDLFMDAFQTMWGVDGSSLPEKLARSLLVMPVPESITEGYSSIVIECIAVALEDMLPLDRNILLGWVKAAIGRAELPIHPSLPRIVAAFVRHSLGFTKCTPAIMPAEVTRAVNDVDWFSLWREGNFDSDGLIGGRMSMGCTLRKDHVIGATLAPSYGNAVAPALLLLYFALCCTEMVSNAEDPFVSAFHYELSALPLRWILRVTSCATPTRRTWLQDIHFLLLPPILRCCPELFCAESYLQAEIVPGPLPCASVAEAVSLYDARMADYLATWTAKDAKEKPQVVATALRFLLAAPDQCILKCGEKVIEATLSVICDWCDAEEAPLSQKPNVAPADTDMDVDNKVERDSSARILQECGGLLSGIASLCGMLASVWRRLYWIHPTPQSLETLTINILVRKGTQSATKRAFTYSSLVREPLVIFRCRSAALVNPDLLSITLVCLGSFLVASRAAVAAAARFRRASTRIAPTPPLPVSVAAASSANGSTGKEDHAPQQGASDTTAGASSEGVSVKGAAGGGSTTESPLQIAMSDVLAQSKMFLQVQDLIVIRCLMNICHVSSLHSGSDRQSGASSNEEPETLAAVLSLCSGAKSARIREEACGMIQAILAEDPFLGQLLLLQMCPLAYLPILLEQVPAFAKPAEAALRTLLCQRSMDKRAFAVQVAALLALKCPISPSIAHMCRDAIKIVTSMVTAVAAGAPLSAILLLGRMSEPLVAIGAAYPKLAGDATSAVERMIHSGAFDADRLPQAHEDLMDAYESLSSGGALGSWSFALHRKTGRQ